MSLISLAFFKRKSIINKLKEKDAISEDTAISLDNLGILKQSLDLVQILINDKVLIKTKDNKYYINIKK